MQTSPSQESPTTAETPYQCENCDSTKPLVAEFDMAGVVHSCPSCGFKPRKAQAPKPAKAETTVRTVAVPAGNLVDQVRARLAALDVDIERLEALKRERKQLQRMLRAAETKR